MASALASMMLQANEETGFQSQKRNDYQPRSMYLARLPTKCSRGTKVFVEAQCPGVSLLSEEAAGGRAPAKRGSQPRKTWDQGNRIQIRSVPASLKEYATHPLHRRATPRAWRSPGKLSGGGP